MRKSQQELDDEKDLEKQIKKLYGHLETDEVDGYNSPRDRNIASMVIGKYFSKYPKHLKKEIFDNCILELWAKRSQFNAEKGKYKTWGFKVARNAMLKQYGNQVSINPKLSLDNVVGVSDNGRITTNLDLYADIETAVGIVDLEKFDKANLSQKAKTSLGENEKIQTIIAMTLVGHPPREIMKVVNVCRQYIDKIKRKYKHALIEIEAERNSKRAVS